MVDAYRAPYIPPQLTTVEFFRIVADHLQPDGVLAINIGRAPNDRSLINGLATTIGTIFPSIYVMDIPSTFNSVLYATRMPTERQNLADNLLRLQAQGGTQPLLLESMLTTWQNLQPTPPQTMVFTDDRAPIEWLTNNLILNFLLQGGMEKLQ